MFEGIYEKEKTSIIFLFILNIKLTQSFLILIIFLERQSISSLLTNLLLHSDSSMFSIPVPFLDLLSAHYPL